MTKLITGTPTKGDNEMKKSLLVNTYNAIKTVQQ